MKTKQNKNNMLTEQFVKHDTFTLSTVSVQRPFSYSCNKHKSSLL